MMTEQQREIQERVSRGAKTLDTIWPEWAAQIDAERLAMANHRYCVLGQLYGDFGHGWAVLEEKLDDPCAPRYGFDIGGGQQAVIEYDGLRDAWLRAIAVRLGRKTLTPEQVETLDAEADREMIEA